MAVSAGAVEALLRIRDELSPALRIAARNVKQFSKENAKALSETAKHFDLAAKGAAAMGAAVAAGGAYAVKSMLDLADGLSNMEAQTGLSTQALQELGFAGAAVGVSTEDVADSVTKMSKSLVDGSQESVDAVARLGLSMGQLKSEAPDKAFQDILTSLQGIQNPMERTALAMQLLGRGGAALIPLGEGLAAARKRAEELGAVMDEKSIRAADALGDSLGELGKVAGGFVNHLGDVVTSSAAAADFVEGLKGVFGGLSKGVEENKVFLQSLVTGGIKLLAEALAIVMTLVSGSITAIGNLTQSYYGAQSVVLGLVKTFYDYKAVLAWIAGDTAAEKQADDMSAALEIQQKLVEKTGAEFQEKFQKVADVMAVAAVKAHDLGSSIRDGVVAVAPKIPPVATHIGTIGKAAAEAAKKAKELGASIQKEMIEASTAGLGGLAAAFGKVDAHVSEFRAKIAEIKDVDLAKSLTAQLDELSGKLKDVALDAERVRVLGQSFADVTKEVGNLAAVFALTGGAGKLTNESLLTLLASLRDLQAAHLLTAQGALVQAAAQAELNKRIAEGKVLAPGVVEDIKAQLSWWQRLTFSWKSAKDALQQLGDKLGTAIDRGFGAADAIMGMKSAFSAATDSGSRFANAFGGAKVGASIGASIGGLLGPIGAAWGKVIGAVIGGIIGLFKKASWKKVGEQIATDMGLDKALSKELSKAIEKMAKDLNVSVAQAGLLSLDKIMEETGKTAGEMSKQVFDLFQQQFPAGSKAAAQQLQTLDTIWGDVRKSATATGDAMTVAMLKAAQASGHMTDSMKAFVSEQNKAMSGGAEKIFDGLSKIGLNDVGPEMGERMARSFTKGFQAAIAEDGLVAALDSLGKQAEEMFNAMTQSGATAGAKLLEPFAALQKQIGDNDQIKGMLQALEGMGDIFKGSANQGLLDPQMMADFGEEIAHAHDALVGAGVDGKAAMMAVMPELKAAIDAAQQMGVPLDAKTAELKAAAEDMGFSFPIDPMIQLVDLMKTLVQGMGFELPESAQRAGAAMTGAGAAAREAAGATSDSMRGAGEAVAAAMAAGAAASTTSLTGFADQTKAAVTTMTDSIVEHAEYFSSQVNGQVGELPIIAGRATEETLNVYQAFSDMVTDPTGPIAAAKDSIMGVANAWHSVASATDAATRGAANYRGPGDPGDRRPPHEPSHASGFYSPALPADYSFRAHRGERLEITPAADTPARNRADAQGAGPSGGSITNHFHVAGMTERQLLRVVREAQKDNRDGAGTQTRRSAQGRR